MLKSKSLILVIAFLFASQTNFANDFLNQLISKSDEIETWINTHFPEHKTKKFQMEIGLFYVKYEVMLEDNVTLKFNRKKQIIEIVTEDRLPESIIPPKISSYISKNYPESYITLWENTGRRHEIELNNGINLVFRSSGEFLRVVN